MSRIVINGITYEGNDVTVVNDKVIIDGHSVNYGTSTEPIKVIVHGDVANLTCHNAEITGDVYNDVDAHNVTCDTIGGNVNSHNVICEYIKGNVDAHKVKTMK
jgi:hypothetical protein